MPNQALAQLLGAFIGQQSPKQNPNFIGIEQDPTTGKLVWANNQAPYLNAGFGTKLFHPDVAREVGSLNDALYRANLSDDVSKRIAQGNVDLARKVLGQDVTTADLAGVTELSNRNPSALFGVNTLNERYKAGVPKLEAEAEALNAKTSSAKSVADLIGNLPARRAAAESTQLDYTVPLLKHRIEDMPNMFADEELERQIKNARGNRELSNTPLLNDLSRFELENKLNDSRIEGALGNTRLSMLPQLKGTLTNSIIANLFNSGRIPGQSDSPLGARVNPKTGMIDANVPDPTYVDPAIIMQDKLRAAMSGINVPKVAPTIIDKTTGKPVAAPPSSIYQNANKPESYDPMTGRLIGQQTIAPATGKQPTKENEVSLDPNSVQAMWDKETNKVKQSAVEKYHKGVPLTPYERSLFTLEEWRQLIGYRNAN